MHAQAAQANPGLAELPEMPEEVGDAADPLALAHSYIMESASSKIALPRLNSGTSKVSLASARSRPRTAPQARSKAVLPSPKRKVCAGLRWDSRDDVMRVAPE